MGEVSMPRETKLFSQHLRRFLSLAQEGAERLQDRYIGPEHLLLIAEEEAERAGHDEIATTDLLLGLLGQNETTIIDILRKQNISADELEKKVRQSVQ